MEFVTVDITNGSHDFSNEIPLSFQSTTGPPVVIMQEQQEQQTQLSSEESSCGYKCGMCCKKCVKIHDRYIGNSNTNDDCPKASVCCIFEGIGYLATGASSVTGCISSMFFCCTKFPCQTCTPAIVTAISAGSLLALGIASFGCAGTLYSCNKHAGHHAKFCGCPRFARGFDKEK